MTTDQHHPPVELVVLLASAGGLEPLSIVLRDLPAEFPAAVVVQQHLGGLSSVLPTLLGRQTPHGVSWARDGQALAAGHVAVCPPRMHLEVAPDGICWLHETEPLGERRFDLLLASVAKSYGARSVAVVLSGSGQDGAVGTVAMKRAGAIVIAQSPETAKYASMPMAAARSGADLVLPIYRIGHVLADIVAGAPLVKPRPDEGGAAIPLGPLAQRPTAGRGDEATTVEVGAEGETVGTGGETATQLDEAMGRAAARAESARDRAAELRRRHDDLSEGFGATADTVSIARHRAQESIRRAQLAHQAAKEAVARWATDR
ncbi:chemotaxis protein CheB [Mycobacterium sp. 852002-51057_SCH5723018]|uniref:chemotaxis protein CheB n=1 Tax=Mycobacterium sp. 852002-51057_SCH5723018 TaxID=1834094 RepID=UPI000A8E5915|nr:chemotaxis protein CheB [Mycobacterium sp. 852002-51057_SCH5723018]